MTYYAYLGQEPLGKEQPLGTENRLMFAEVDDRKAIAYAREVYDGKESTRGQAFRLYSYTNIYDNNTFTLIYVRTAYQPNAAVPTGDLA